MDACLVIACGALAHEITALRAANGWDALVVRCLPADLHNHPQRITPAVREAIERARPSFARIFVAYGDCGTGGQLDALLAELGVERLPGAHCYEFYAGPAAFAALAEAEPGTFYVTDFLARHFERLVIRGLGIDRHPELLPMYFGNYRRLVFLGQNPDPSVRAELREAAQQGARRLGLAFEERHCGYGGLREGLVRFYASRSTDAAIPGAVACPS